MPVRKAQVAAAWERRFAELRAFHEEHGHCRVPHTHPSPPLKNWVSKQRRRYHQSGGTLPGRRAARLDDLGFAWHAHDAVWDGAFAALCEFRRREGHCRVPKAHVAAGSGRALGEWVHVQRKKHKNGELPEDRRRRLEDVGFVWAVTYRDDAGWEEKFRELVRQKEREGDCIVPCRYSANPPLGRWAGKQRENYRNGKLRPERFQKLADIGFVWHAGNAGKASAHGRKTAQSSKKGEKKKEETTRSAIDTKKQAVATAQVHASGKSGTRRRTGRSTPSLSASPTQSNLPKKPATKAQEQDRSPDLSNNGSAIDKDVESMQQQLAEAKARFSELHRRLAAAEEDKVRLTTEVARRAADAARLQRETTARWTDIARLACAAATLRPPALDGRGARGRAGARYDRGADADADRGFTPFLATEWLQRK